MPDSQYVADEQRRVDIAVNSNTQQHTVTRTEMSHGIPHTQYHTLSGPTNHLDTAHTNHRDCPHTSRCSGTDFGKDEETVLAPHCYPDTHPPFRLAPY